MCCLCATYVDRALFTADQALFTWQWHTDPWVLFQLSEQQGEHWCSHVGVSLSDLQASAWVVGMSKCECHRYFLHRNNLQYKIDVNTSNKLKAKLFKVNILSLCQINISEKTNWVYITEEHILAQILPLWLAVEQEKESALLLPAAGSAPWRTQQHATLISVPVSVLLTNHCANIQTIHLCWWCMADHRWLIPEQASAGMLAYI